MDAADAGAGERGALAEAARTLAETARSRARQAERERRLPAETVAETRRSGLARILQPARCGGLELGLSAHFETVEEVARGCGSTAWCLAVFHVDSWLVGLFGKDAQDDVYAGNPDSLVAGVRDPRGAARRRGDGLVVTGSWPFGSGSEHADWAILGAELLDADGRREDGICVAVPAADLTTRDDWHAAGLSGTGSCSICCEDVFVPAHRTISVRDAGLGRAPGAALHASRLYRAPMAPFVAFGLCAPAVGLAAGAVEDFSGHVSGRTDGHLRDAPEIENPLVHQTVAGAHAGIDTARALLRRAAADIEEAADRGGRMTRGTRARVRMDCAYAVDLCRRAVDDVFLACGGAGLSDAHPVQRAWRDVHAVSQHAMLRFRTATEIYGRVLLGLAPGTDIL